MREGAQSGTPCSVEATQHYWGDQITNYEMSEACGTYGVEERCLQAFGRVTSGKGITWET
jgi:hypothetical protein